MALLLASLGLYAVIAQSASERTAEIGVRTALGAGAPQIVGLALSQALRAVGIGLVLGLAGWFAMSAALRASISDVSTTDPISLAIACTVLIVSSAIGCLVPARRALRVSPAVALRHET